MTVNRLAAVFVIATAASALWSCGSHEQKLADATTRAIYDNNIGAVTDSMTPALRQQVTREQVGAISDIMHAHGTYNGLTETGTEPDGAYDFRADFSKGNFIVKMRLDGSDKIAGYRVIPQPSK
jgi:hypothetical protein